MEEKIYALKPAFIEELHDEWKNKFSNANHADFISYINDKYKGEKLKSNYLSGDNGIFIDQEVALQLNNSKKVGSEANWDYTSSLMLFEGCGNGMGIFQKDDNGNRVPLDMVYATDTRIWNYLSLFRLSEYTQKRWGGSKDSRRIFINRLSNEKTTRHAIMRLYWTANICFDPKRDKKLELLQILWRTNDFMTQVTERQQANMKQQTLWFLDFCKVEENESKLFNEKSIEGYDVYRKFLKLYLAENNIVLFSDTDKEQFYQILSDILEAC